MSFWDRHQSTIDANKFRGEYQYLSSQNDYPYQETCDFIRTLKKPWLDTLKEDDAFGCVTSTIDNVVVSRDLLDSILEIEFLERCGLTLDNMSIIDIGAGYGRLAHRIAEAYPNSFVYCTDGVPLSQELCRKYLEFRSIKNAEVVLPDELDKISKPDLAINIHSFPECTRAAINGWLDWLVANKVPNLFIIPHPFNTPEFACLEDNRSFLPEINAHGYKIEHHWKPLNCFPRDFYLFTQTF